MQLLKIALEHSRFQAGPGDPFFWHPVAKAFPSGNSAGALAITLAISTLAVSVGLLSLDYHYPSDILGGWLVALGWCFALVALQQRQEAQSK